MTTISVPLPQDLIAYIESVIDMNEAETKAEVVRKALRKMREDDLVDNLLKAEQEYKNGKTLKGDLRKLLGENNK
ncbi:MAG: hypothetical protein WCO84_03250 [bacterium]